MAGYLNSLGILLYSKLSSHGNERGRNDSYIQTNDETILVLARKTMILSKGIGKNVF